MADLVDHKSQREADVNAVRQVLVYRVSWGECARLKLKYTDLTKNTYIRSWTVTEIMVREVWKYDSCYTIIDYQIHIKTGRNKWFL
jgi:hypothetical protein